MSRSERKYTLDTNIFIRAFRDCKANAELQLFHTAFAPFEYLSAVVVQELRAGTRGKDAAALQRALFDPFERRGRVLTPGYDAWKRTGEVMSVLAAKEGLEIRRVPRSFVNDILLAVTCREAGVVLVTDNTADFERIRRVLPFEFVAPWPRPSGRGQGKVLQLP
jgi:predicted nucleic acid-binding protein